MPRNWKNARFGSARGFIARHLLKMNHHYWRDIEQLSVHEVRDRLEKLEQSKQTPPDSIEIEHVKVDGLHIQYIHVGDVNPDYALLYIHGGGFLGGSPDTTHTDFIWRLAEKTGCAVYAPFYRKSPEYSYPAALDDVLKSYQYLLDGPKPKRIAVAGDSSGGGLAVALIFKIRELGLPMPSALSLLSPWVDLKGTGMSVITNWATDSLVPGHLISQIGALYLAGESPENPFASPLYGEFHDFPPTLIQVSDKEVLYDDSRRLADKMEEASVDVQLDIWRNQPHVWQLFARWVPESRAAIDDIADFLKLNLV